MKKFKKLALLCTAILACGVMATTTGCDLFQPIPDGPTSESSTPEVKTYTVVWKDADGSVLETDESVEEGAIPTYDGEEPKKASENSSSPKLFSLYAM